jgi:hypothetical protein
MNKSVLKNISIVAQGLEVEDEVIYGPQSVVMEQAENRLHAPKAPLTLLINEDCNGIADIEDPSVDTTQGVTTTQSLMATQDTEPTSWLPGFEWMLMTMGILILPIRSLRSRLSQSPSHKSS